MDIESATWVQPAGVGALLTSQLEGDINITLTDHDSSSIKAVGAIFEGVEQDFCEPTVDFPEADFDDPGFVVGPGDISVDMQGISIEINNLYMSGMFASDCSWVGRGEVEGEVDARQLAPAMADLLGTNDPEEICALLAGFGVECQPCSTDGEPLCMTVELEDLVGVEQDGIEVECVALENCHPKCGGNDCEDPSDGEC